MITKPKISNNTENFFQQAFQCENCGAHRVYDPGTQQMLCTHCATFVPIKTTQKSPWGQQEIPIHLFPTDKAEVQEAVHSCNNCAGEVSFIGPAISEHCPYCNGPVVRRPNAKGYAVSAVAPFSIQEKEARDSINTWFNTRLCLPNTLKNNAKTGRITGIYAPFWTFDTRAVIHYQGARGKKVGKKTQWTSVEGTFEIHFDDHLMPGSEHITADIRDATGPWPVTELQDFQPYHLSGFAAEMHQHPVTEGFSRTKKDVNPIIEAAVKRAIGGSSQRITTLNVTWMDVTCRTMLLPLWVMLYKHDEKTYRVVCSGITGKAFGERPFSPYKLRILTALWMLPAIAIGIFLSVSGLISTQ